MSVYENVVDVYNDNNVSFLLVKIISTHNSTAMFLVFLGVVIAFFASDIVLLREQMSNFRGKERRPLQSVH